jgi:hypothetical protein
MGGLRNPRLGSTIKNYFRTTAAKQAALFDLYLCQIILLFFHSTFTFEVVGEVTLVSRQGATLPTTDDDDDDDDDDEAP